MPDRKEKTLDFGIATWEEGRSWGEEEGLLMGGNEGIEGMEWILMAFFFFYFRYLECKG